MSGQPRDRTRLRESPDGMLTQLIRARRIGPRAVDEVRQNIARDSRLGIGYLGNLAGYTYVHEVMGDPLFERFVRAFMDEVTPLVGNVPGIDLAGYKETLVERFGNTAVKDTTARLCQHGSARVPKFVLPSALELNARGGRSIHTALVVAGYLRYLQGGF